MSADLRKMVYQNSLRRKEKLNKEMLIALFGASGKTGIFYVEQAVNSGKELLASLRNLRVSPSVVKGLVFLLLIKSLFS